MSELSVVILAKEAKATRAAVDSVLDQVDGLQMLVAGDLEADAALRDALVPHEGDATLLAVSGEETLGAWRNTALARCEREFVLFVDPGERVARDSLARHLESLRGDPSLVASYGRTAVHEFGRVRVRPDQGRSGRVTRRLLKEKHLLASSASLAWRRAALDDAPFQAFNSPVALRLEIGLQLSRAGDWVFHPAVVAEREGEEVDLAGLEEVVKVLIGVLYSGTPLDEKVEQRARFRLARHLVAMGKIHYRNEDHKRASSFFDEALKAAPGYFKGRRYQFMNFVKNTITRSK